MKLTIRCYDCHTPLTIKHSFVRPESPNIDAELLIHVECCPVCEAATIETARERAVRERAVSPLDGPQRP